MRVVIATTVEDPLSAAFWQAYGEAGGLPPAAVFFIAPRRQVAITRRVAEATLLFGPLDAGRSWARGRRVRQMLLAAPRHLFPGTDAFFHVRTLNGGEGLAALQGQSPAVLVSVGAPEIFKPAVLGIPSVGAVNVHNGRLPAYRGLFGTFWEVRQGEEWGYASLHVMEPEVDAGPVLAQGAVWMAGRNLLQILLAKKRQGGRLLAWLVRFIERERRLPPPCPHNGALSSRYYPWPSLRQMAIYRLMRSGRLRVPAGQRTAPFLWPPGVVAGEMADGTGR